MNISYFENSRIFKIDTATTSYIMAVVDEEQFLGHVYYGPLIKDADVSYRLRLTEPPFVPSKNNRDRSSFLDAFHFEYSSNSVGDFRDSSISVRDINGNSGILLLYQSHRIFKGKKKIPGLPATFGNDEDSMTLEIAL